MTDLRRGSSLVLLLVAAALGASGLAACAGTAPTSPPISALPHDFPELEARLAAVAPGDPVVTASYDGEFAAGDEDLQGGPFTLLATELVPHLVGSPRPELDRLQVAEAFVGTGHPYRAVIRAYRLPGAPQSRWVAVLDGLVAGRPGLLSSYSPTPIQSHPTLDGTPMAANGRPSLVFASGDTLYELIGDDREALRSLGAALP